MGDLLRPLRALLAVVPLSATGCGAIAGAGALGMCSPSGDHELTILSPDHGAAFDGEPFEVRFRLEDNDYEVEVIAYVHGGRESGRVRIPPKQREGSITVFPPVDSGALLLELQSSSSSGNDQGWSRDERSIQWTAPWRVDRVERCEGQGCDLEDGMTLTGRVAIAPLVRYDADRLTRAEVRVGDVTLGAATAPPFRVAVDLDAIADGDRTLTSVVVRDDGRVATADRAIEVANCARVTNHPYARVLYTDDAARITAGVGEIQHVDLARDTTRAWVIGDQPAGPLAYDDAGTILAGDHEAVWAIDVASTAPPALAVQFDGPPDLTSLALAPDGTLYATTGRPSSGAVTKKLLRIAGGEVAEVPVAPLVPSTVFVDDDGTLLLGAGPELWRLTLEDGVEIARARVLSRPGGYLVHVAKDELGRTYVVDALAGEVARYASLDGAPEVLHRDERWDLIRYPLSLSFLKYPARCHGLQLSGIQFLSPARVVIDVGEVRGRP